MIEDYDEKKIEYDTQSITLMRRVITVRNEFIMNEMPKWNDRVGIELFFENQK